MPVEFAEAVQEHLVDIDSVQPYPDNPRRGDLKALKESILTNGFYSTILVQRSTGYVVAGNHRLKALKELGAEQVPAMFMDISDADAVRIVLADNRTSDLAFYDDPTLFKLLQDLEGDFSGTGYDRASYELLLQGLEGDEILGKVQQGNTPEDRVSDYIDSDIRSVILPYAGAEYDTVAGGLKVLRERLDVDTNAAVVAILVQTALDNPEWFDEAPEP